MDDSFTLRAGRDILCTNMRHPTSNVAVHVLRISCHAVTGFGTKNILSYAFFVCTSNMLLLEK